MNSSHVATTQISVGNLVFSPLIFFSQISRSYNTTRSNVNFSLSSPPSRPLRLRGSLKKISTPFPNLNFPQPPRTNNSLAIGANRHSANVARMPAQITSQFARSHIPKSHTLIPTPSNQRSAIPTESHRPNPVSMPA